MDFYVIPPNGNLELMNHGDRFFCLAQQYNKDAAYREFFKQKVKEDRWVTLDNGAGDHDIVTEDLLFDIMEDLCPSEVIPPDILFDAITTIQNLERFIKRKENICSHGQVPSKYFDMQILACPQGKTKEEWLFVYEYMLRHPNVDTIGMSKIAVPNAFLGVTGDKMIKQSRHLAYETLKAKSLIQKPLHFLGMGDPTEMEMYKGDQLCRSTDSCNTIWSAMNYFIWEIGDLDRTPTPKDYFTRQINEIQYSLALDNINWFRQLLK